MAPNRTLESEHTTSSPMFLAPGAGQWQALDEQGESPHSARDELDSALLMSLQMHHVVVLAGLGCSLSAGGPTMMDLWMGAVGKEPSEMVHRVAKNVRYDLDDKNIEVLLSKVEAYLQLRSDDEASSFLKASKQIILDKCSRFHETGALDSHVAFLHRLSRRRARDERLRVFTTNYDLCFEKAASQLGIVALDGFSFYSPRSYDPRFFSYDIVRRPRSGSGEVGSFLEGVFLIHKLHGSVNWARTSDDKIMERAHPTPDEACLIYPAAGKFQQSFSQPHLEFMAQYFASLREPNTCLLVVGFGFNDAHLAEPLIAAAQSNPHFRLVVVDPAAKERVDNGSGYWGRLAKLGSQGGDIWFVSARFDEFSQMIPDLKSLTPADALVKAIRGVAKTP
ncbi:MAG: SIR2 family protein [Acidobacteriota bacterium]